MTDSDAVRCPFCHAASAQLLSLFGSQLLLSQYRCGSCASYFEGVRPDRWDADPVGATTAENGPAPAQRARPSRGAPPPDDPANDASVARVCDHPGEPALPATGENEDGR